MENIRKAKGFINKNGEKVQMIPAKHEHSIREVTGLQDTLDGKADVRHVHARIQDEDLRAEVECGTVGSTDVGKIKLYVEDSEGEGQSAEITANNIANLQRALLNPDSTPTTNSGNLVTSGGVKNALAAKADKVVGATAGNLASFDAEGNLQDSGNNYNEMTKVSLFKGDVKATKANGSIVSLLDTVEDVDATKEKLSITIERGIQANPTFGVTAGSKNVLKALINKLIQDKAYACIVNMRVGSVGTYRIYSVGGTILWTEKEVDNVVHREITLYVGFTKFVTLCVAGESGWDDPTWSLTWTRSEVDDTPFSDSAVTDGSSSIGEHEVDPGTSHTDGPL